METSKCKEHLEDRTNSKYKSPGADWNLACSRNSKMTVALDSSERTMAVQAESRADKVISCRDV